MNSKLGRQHIWNLIWYLFHDSTVCTGFYLGFIVWGRSPEWPKATNFLGGSGGMSHLEIFSDEYTQSLRCNLVHLKRQFWEMLRCVHWPGRHWIFSDIVTYRLWWCVKKNVSQASYQSLQTTITEQVCKTTIYMPFNLLQVCPSVLLFVALLCHLYLLPFWAVIFH